MDNSYRTDEDGLLVVDGSRKSKSQSQNQFSFNYVEEWNYLFMCPDFINKTRNTALKGTMRNTRFRSICWRLHLDCLPEDQTKWVMHTRNLRKKYQELSENFHNNPRGNAKNDFEDLKLNNPLSQEKNSEWNQYFQDTELQITIKQDVERTFPEIEFFQNDWVKEIMIKVLFCHAKQFPKVSYKQGMHELLAPILFVIYSDHQAFIRASEEASLELFYSFTREMIRELMDPKYLEHDAYILFCQLMDSVEQWFLVRDINPFKKDIYSIEPFAQQQETDFSNVIILKLKRISDQLLKKHDCELYNHLEQMEIAPQIYGIRWLRLLFGREFPLQDLLVIWDALFADGPSLGLVDYVFVSMLMYIRSLLLTNDYATCLTFLMRYPGIADVNYIIDHSLFLRDPMKYVKPPTYSEKMIKHVPTVGGIPNIHRAPQNNKQSSVSSGKSHAQSGKSHISASRPSTLSINDRVEIDKNGQECKSNRFIEKKNKVSLPSMKVKKIAQSKNDSIWNTDTVDRKKNSNKFRKKEEELTEIKSTNKQKKFPIPAPRTTKQSTKKVSDETKMSIDDYETKFDEIQRMHTYCSFKMSSSIDKLQDTILQKNLENEDDLLLALAALKQVRDVLQGTLKFTENLLESDGKGDIESITDGIESTTIHKSTITLDLANDKLTNEISSNVGTSLTATNDHPLGYSSGTDYAVEALLSTDDCIEPQLECIQFTDCDEN